jgi:hypothetical protein
MNKFKIDSPSPEMAKQDAKRYLDFMEPSFRYGGVEYNLEDFTEMVGGGEWLLIRVWDDAELISVSAVQVRNLPDGRDLYLIATASTRDFQKWVYDFDKVLVELAKEANCETITVLTRNGVGKLSKAAGYKVHQVVIRKRVGKWAVH